MTITAPIVCLLLGWNGNDSAPARLADLPAYPVMQVKSGVELVVKRDGQLTPVRLLGIDTPRTEATPEVDTINQMKHLRELIPVGSQVRLVASADAPGRGQPILAAVYRAKDGLWVNLAMLEQGYATASAGQSNPSSAAFRAAEKEARAAQRGMWSPDYLATAQQPSRFDRAPKSRSRSPRGPRNVPPPPGSLPALGLGLAPGVPVGLPMVNPTLNPFAFPTSGALWGSNTGLGFGSSMGLGVGGLGFPFGGGTGVLGPGSFTTGPNGRPLTPAQQNQLYQQYVQQQRFQAAQAQQFLDGLRAAALQAQDGGPNPQGTATGGFGSVPAGGHVAPGAGTAPAHPAGPTYTRHNR